SSRHYGGLGLGLYISSRVIDAHGGSISVKSAPGAGTAFTVDLPMDPK
ncbi:MAG: PAS domain-containing sensor histidine kinase, partial [Polyangiaceae bacterium]|nr:PAS domain-containing sensor histidine kinase [Polyangiaceae bacterium]